MRIGDTLSSEEHGPNDLVRFGAAAERAGFDHDFLHQVGPDQEPFLSFCAEEILPKL